MGPYDERKTSEEKMRVWEGRMLFPSHTPLAHALFFAGRCFCLPPPIGSLEKAKFSADCT